MPSPGGIRDPDEAERHRVHGERHEPGPGAEIRVSEAQTKQVFHDEGDVLIVAEKYQTEL